jgi:hypothetical protein
MKKLWGVGQMFKEKFKGRDKSLRVLIKSLRKLNQKFTKIGGVKKNGGGGQNRQGSKMLISLTF